MDRSSLISIPTIDVALALVWRRGCVLISRRRADAHLGGLWEFPGGKCAPGESPEDCAVREAMEEVGVHCAPTGRRAVIIHDYDDRTVRLHPVDCDYLGGPPRPIQVAECAWVVPADLGRYPFPAANEALLAELMAAG